MDLRAVNAQDGQKLKIIVLGDFGVGKSSIINQYVHGKFQEGQVLHFPEPLLKDVQVQVQSEGASQRVTLQIHDTGGRERQGTPGGGLEAAFFSNANACILVYDVNDRVSMMSLQHWRNAFINRATSNPSEARRLPLIVLGNKVDPDGLKTKQLQNEVATTWCAKEGIKHFVTSAKDNRSVVEAFQHVARLALQFNKQELNQKLPGSVTVNGASQRRPPLGDIIRPYDHELNPITTPPKPPPTTGGCCSSCTIL